MRFCHLSSHTRIDCPCGCGGCECVHNWDRYVMPDTPLIGTVPGGHNDSAQHQFHREFDKGMYAYEKARKEGLQPTATTVAAVEAEHKAVKSQQRALKKLSKNGDVSEVSVRPGVKG